MRKTIFALFLIGLMLIAAACGDSHKERTVTLPGLAGEYAAVTAVDGYYYYIGYKGKTPCVYKAPVDAPGKNSVVYAFEDWSDVYRDYPLANVYKQDGQLYISCYVGGASMGGELLYKVYVDGTVEQMELGGKLDFREAEGGYVYADQFMPPGPGNLYFTQQGREDAVSIGDSQYVYGCIGKGSAMGANSCGGGEMMLVKDGWVYLPAFRYDDAAWTNYVWKVNLKTHEAVQVTHIPLDSCTTDGNYVYSMSGGQLYRTSLNGGADELILNESCTSYALNQSTLWYVDLNYRLHRKSADGTAEILHPDVNVQSVRIESGHILCDLMVGDKTGLLVLGPDGDQEYKTEKALDSYTVDGDVLVFKEMVSLTVNQVQLQ